MDFEKIKSAAEGYKAEMSRFLRDMISHPSESCEEREVVHCIKAEMEKLGYDKYALMDVRIIPKRELPRRINWIVETEL